MPHPFYKGFLAAAAVLVFSSGALAADTMALQKGWSVGPILAKAQDGRGYCSMKSSYGAGTELVFARDALGSNSIAIQLSRKNLQAGKTYPLTLAVGPVERKAEAMAATETVLIAQMGADEIFYDMLARKAVMTAKFEGHDFSFGLQGTSKALMALDNCAAAMNAGQRPKQVRVGLPPVFSDATGGFDAPIASPEVTGGPVVIKVSRPVSEKPLAKESDDVSSLEIERLRAENRALELENQAAQERLRVAELKKQEIDHKKESAAEARARALAAENEKLKAELVAKEKAEKLARLKEEDRKKKQDESTRAAAVSAENERLKAALVLKEKMEALARLQAAEFEKKLSDPSVKDLRTRMPEGVGVEHPWPAGKTFLSAVEEYIASTGKKCTGDFAHKLGEVRKAGASETVEAEIACIGGMANDAAAALLFVSDAGRFIVVTQEGPTEKMPESLQKRAEIAALFE